MKAYSAYHTIHYLKKTDFFNIEIITYDHQGHYHSSFVPRMKLTGRQKSIMDNYTSSSIAFEPLNEGDQAMPLFLRLKTSNERESHVFWETVGFKSVTDSLDTDPRQFSFISPFHRDVIIEFEKGNHESLVYLDDEGCTSLAFLSSNLEKDHAFFLKRGFLPSKITELEVNKKRIRIFFIRDPGVVIIEFLSASL